MRTWCSRGHAHRCSENFESTRKTFTGTSNPPFSYTSYKTLIFLIYSYNLSVSLLVDALKILNSSIHTISTLPCVVCNIVELSRTFQPIVNSSSKMILLLIWVSLCVDHMSLRKSRKLVHGFLLDVIKLEVKAYLLRYFGV